MQRVGNKVTYEGTDSYTDLLKYASERGAMIINITGHKIGDCDNPR